jgi:DNA-binding response OmpR family regulator
MKRNIHFIPLDTGLARWLRDMLTDAPQDMKCTRDMISGLNNYISGETSMLILGDGANTQNVISDEIRAGDLLIQPRSRKVLRGGIEVVLTPKEFDLLYFLVENRGEVFTKEQIYKAVWDEDFLLADSNIMAFIRKLRKKIEPNPDWPEYILTIWGIGYKFNDQI